MLEGKKVRLKRLDKDDLSFYLEFRNNPTYYGQYVDFQRQISETEFISRLENPSSLLTTLQLAEFVIEKKDGTKIGLIGHYVIPGYGWMEIGPAISPSEAGKRYGTEAMQIMVDYLFLTTDISRITELTNVRNVAAQKCYEKVGFKKEGTIRKARYYRREWADHYIYGILREEWKEPKMLTKATQQKKSSRSKKKKA